MVVWTLVHRSTVFGMHDFFFFLRGAIGSKQIVQVESGFCHLRVGIDTRAEGKTHLNWEGWKPKSEWATAASSKGKERTGKDRHWEGRSELRGLRNPLHWTVVLLVSSAQHHHSAVGRDQLTTEQECWRDGDLYLEMPQQGSAEKRGTLCCASSIWKLQ